MRDEEYLSAILLKVGLLPQFSIAACNDDDAPAFIFLHFLPIPRELEGASSKSRARVPIPCDLPLA